MVNVTLTTKEPSVGLLVREGFTDLLKVHVSEAIASYVSLLHSSRTVGVDAIVTMSEYLLENYDVKQLRISELKTFFTLAFKQQKYGKLYGGFGYDTLLEWLNQFCEERMQSIIEYRENEHITRTTYEKRTRERTEGDAFGVGELITKQNEQNTQDGHTDTGG